MSLSRAALAILVTPKVTRKHKSVRSLADHRGREASQRAFDARNEILTKRRFDSFARTDVFAGGCVEIYPMAHVTSTWTPLKGIVKKKKKPEVDQRSPKRENFWLSASCCNLVGSDGFTFYDIPVALGHRSRGFTSIESGFVFRSTNLTERTAQPRCGMLFGRVRRREIILSPIQPKQNVLRERKQQKSTL